MEERRVKVLTCPSVAVEKSATGTGGRLVLSWAPGDWTEVGKAPPFDWGGRAILRGGPEIGG